MSKKESWKKRLMSETQIHLPSPEREDSHTYLSPDSASFLPGKNHKILLRYGLSAAAAVVVTVVCISTVLKLNHTQNEQVDGNTNTTSAGTTVSSRPGETAGDITDVTSVISGFPSEEAGVTQPQSTAPIKKTDAIDTMTQPGVHLVAKREDMPIGGWTEIFEDGSFAVFGRGANYECESARIAYYTRTGELIFSDLFLGSIRNSFDWVKQTKDGGLLAVGITSLSGPDFEKYGITGENSSIFIVKYSRTGEVQWAKNGDFGKDGSLQLVVGNKIFEGPNGEILFFSHNWTVDDMVPYVFCSDAQGNPISGKGSNFFSLFDSDSDDLYLGDVEWLSDGTLFVSGVNRQNPDGVVYSPSNERAPVIRKYKFSGFTCKKNELLFERKFDGFKNFYLNKTSDDGLVFTAEINDLRETHPLVQEFSLKINPTYQDCAGQIIIRMNKNGAIIGHDVLYPNYYYSSDHKKAFNVIRLSDFTFSNFTDIGNGEMLFQLNAGQVFYDPINQKFIETAPHEVRIYILDKSGKLRAVSTVGLEKYNGNSQTLSIKPYDGSYLFLTHILIGKQSDDGAAAYLYRVNDVIR